MIYSRQSHSLFLEEELRTQTDEFKRKLDTNARFLLEKREEVFVCQFLKLENGEMILKFPTSRSIPRKGDYNYCFTVPTDIRNYRLWGDMTYGDLIKRKGYATEIVCIWQSVLPDTDDFCIAGFRGVDQEFADHIKDKAGSLLVLGPSVPPYEYIYNLQKIVRNGTSSAVADILDRDYEVSDWDPIVLDGKDISSLIVNQLNVSDTVILQGPPGTGKTFHIAGICRILASQGKSVLVTALTNRALVEVAKKESLDGLRAEACVYKTKLSVDEAAEVDGLRPVKSLQPMPGCIVLSTFYISSGEASEVFGDPPFDVVIMDEASQALLAMFAAAKMLGKKQVYVGDVNQLPPITSLSIDRIAKQSYNAFIDGMKTLSDSKAAPVYTLTRTRRLSPGGTRFTGMFYGNMLQCDSEPIRLAFPELGKLGAAVFSLDGGPSLVTTDLEPGDKQPSAAIRLATHLAADFLKANDKMEISILSFYIETVKALQQSFYRNYGSKRNILIDTVSRVQGLTSDIVIYVIPNTGYSRSLDRRLFNVATSRARRHTIIISDRNIMSLSKYIDEDVRAFIGAVAGERWIHQSDSEQSDLL